MNLRGLFHRAEPAESDPGASVAGGPARPHFSMGVQDRFTLRDSDDAVVAGMLRGTIRTGDEVCLSAVGGDGETMQFSRVLGIETGAGRRAETASDCRAGLLIERGAALEIRCGTVLHARGLGTEELYEAYCSALAGVYIGQKKLDLTPAEEESLSVTDCGELLRMSGETGTGGEAAGEEPLRGDREKTDRLAELLRQKLLAAKSVFCVFSRETGEPYLFSQTFRGKDGTVSCTPPAIRPITTVAKEVWSGRYPEPRFEVREIPGGGDHRGIGSFLGSAFWLDGACGAAVNGAQTVLPAGMLVPQPDCGGMPEPDRPVMNPDLERWLLLMGQMGAPDTPDKNTIYMTWFSLLKRELPKARFLVPVKHAGEIPPGDENGRTVLPEGITISLATVEGKTGRPAVRMYTDWKRFSDGMGEGWEGMIQPVSGMIGRYDCAVNLTKFAAAGCYISRELFDSLPE